MTNKILTIFLIDPIHNYIGSRDNWMVPLGIPAIFLGEHIFKALLQAYIFVLLTMVYVQGAVVHEH